MWKKFHKQRKSWIKASLKCFDGYIRERNMIICVELFCSSKMLSCDIWQMLVVFYANRFLKRLYLLSQDFKCVTVVQEMSALEDQNLAHNKTISFWIFNIPISLQYWIRVCCLISVDTDLQLDAAFFQKLAFTVCWLSEMQMHCESAFGALLLPETLSFSKPLSANLQDSLGALYTPPVPLFLSQCDRYTEKDSLSTSTDLILHIMPGSTCHTLKVLQQKITVPSNLCFKLKTCWSRVSKTKLNGSSLDWLS